MAASKNTAPETDHVDVDDLGEVPKGFENETKLDVDGWWKPEEKIGFFGKLAGSIRIEGRDKVRTVALVELERPAVAWVGKKPNKRRVKLEKGQILGVTLTHALLPIINYLEHKGMVFAKVTGQKDVGQPEPMWTYDLHCKGKKGPPPNHTTIDGTSDDGDAPF